MAVKELHEEYEKSVGSYSSAESSNPPISSCHTRPDNRTLIRPAVKCDAQNYYGSEKAVGEEENSLVSDKIVNFIYQ